MTGHLTSETIELLRDGKLPSGQLLDVSGHLADCEACAKLSREDPMFYQNAADLRSAIAGSGSDPHLTYEQLEGYTNERLSPDAKKAVEIHTSSCDQCRAEIGQFRSLAVLVKEEPNIALSPKVGQWLAGVWSFLRTRPLFAASAAVVSILFAGSIVVWLAGGILNRDEIAADVPYVETEIPELVDGSATEPPGPTVEENDAVANEPSNVRADTGLRVSLVEGDRTIGLTADGKVKGYENLPADLNRSVMDALRNGSVRIGGGVNELRSATGTLMGEDKPDRAGTLRLKGPTGVVLMTRTPKFSWEPLPGAEGYQVEVFDSNFGRVVSSGQLENTRWTTTLRRGETYVWQVTATLDGRQIKAPQRPAPDAKFKVISQDELSKIQTVRRQFPGHSLALGITYAEIGLLVEALNEFDSLAKANPGSPIPRRLRTTVQAAMRDR
ncbi:MAG: hypothetical protein IPM25_14405 [Chloracidobacterium sp.]|nr:hypothetical protein [Chloracidobacterium sp.]